MSLLRGLLLLVLVIAGAFATASTISPAPVAATKTTSLLLWVELRRHDVLRGRGWIISPLVISSPSSASRFPFAFSIRVKPGDLLISCFDSQAY